MFISQLFISQSMDANQCLSERKRARMAGGPGRPALQAAHTPWKQGNHSCCISKSHHAAMHSHVMPPCTVVSCRAAQPCRTASAPHLAVVGGVLLVCLLVGRDAAVRLAGLGGGGQRVPAAMEAGGEQRGMFRTSTQEHSKGKERRWQRQQQQQQS